MLLSQRLYNHHDNHDTRAFKLLLTTLFTSSHVNAIPLTLSPRDDGDDKKLQIILPVVLGVAAILLAIGFIYKNQKMRQNVQRLGRYALAGASVSSGSAPQPTPNVRELTAEQLAGTSGSPTTTTTPAVPAVAANRSRRARRPRRTPSQISTTSLPAYNKEPGEQELVIFRGTQDMEDVVILENDGEDSLHSRNTSDASHYPEVPPTPNTAPLLGHEDESEDHSRTQPPGTDMPVRRSEATGRHEATIDARGDAPAYSVVDLNEEPEVAPASQHGRTSSDDDNSGTVRRSGFRSIFGALGSMRGNPVASTAPRHSRDRSGSSGHAGVSTRAMHRPSQSGSGSLLSLTHHLSRTRSNNTLASSGNGLPNSPSMISLNSISAPLSHTLTRTEMIFPKTGPTPEQLALISSRESLGRFAMPYGSEAIAYASTSRADLVPPPEFEEVPRAGSSLSVLNDARPSSSLARAPVNEEDEHDESNSSLPAADTTAEMSTASEPAHAGPASEPASHRLEATDATVVPPADEEKKEEDIVEVPIAPATELEAQTSQDTKDESTTPAIVETPPTAVASEFPTDTPAPAIAASADTDSHTIASSSAASTSDSSSVTSSDILSHSTAPSTAEAHSKVPPPRPISPDTDFSPAPSPPTSHSNRPPPTAFKGAEVQDRAESRASSFRSMQSFATAQQGGFTDAEVSASDYYTDSGDDTETETNGPDSRRNTMVVPPVRA